MAEEWRPAVGWEDAYEVSNLGDVRRTLSDVPVVFFVHAGYTTCTLNIGGTIRKHGKVHRMVAEAFVNNPAPETKTQVNHIDGNKQNPIAANLEWMTPQENIAHAHRTGLTAGNKRRSRKVESINPETGEIKCYDSAEQAARAVGVDGTRVRICTKQPRSRAAGLHWRLAEDEKSISNNWRELVTCDGYQFDSIAYEVSDLGEVRNTKNFRLLHPSLTESGYYIVNLTVSGQTARRIFGVHRLVASTFLELPTEDTTTYDVDHIDSDPTNNVPINLQWLTRQQHVEKTVGRKVIRYLPNGGRVTYNSITAAARAIGVPYHKMQYIIDAQQKGSDGSMWQYVDKIEKLFTDRDIDLFIERARVDLQHIML